MKKRAYIVNYIEAHLAINNFGIKLSDNYKECIVTGEIKPSHHFIEDDSFSTPVVGDLVQYESVYIGYIHLIKDGKCYVDQVWDNLDMQYVKTMHKVSIDSIDRIVMRYDSDKCKHLSFPEIAWE